ncbi:hypothetical protein [Tellurirhabdus bombi]|uniref:hypothetical protein n=1 Tax=Tellurirhabdus bombi TaxID=2907205 RepID=UPI001F333AA9|nr:hypothetical protein [Tellurirhabdus bombi]
MEFPLPNSLKPFYDAIKQAIDENNDEVLRVVLTATFWAGYNRREEECLEQMKEIPDQINLN